MKKCPEELIDAHWEYVLGILNSLDASLSVIESTEYSYRTAFAHGWKHALESIEIDNRAKVNVVT